MHLSDRRGVDFLLQIPPPPFHQVGLPLIFLFLQFWGMQVTMTIWCTLQRSTPNERNLTGDPRTSPRPHRTVGLGEMDRRRYSQINTCRPRGAEMQHIRDGSPLMELYANTNSRGTAIYSSARPVLRPATLVCAKGFPR